MKWRIVIAVLLIVGGVLIPGEPVQAAPGITQQITVTATPDYAPPFQNVIVTARPQFGVLGPPLNFTVTWITDTQVDISWVKGTSANITMIRSSYDEYPESPTDGTLVYSGIGTGTSDVSLDLDEVGVVFYVAYSGDGAGLFSDDFAEGFMEGFAMTLIAIAFFLFCGLVIVGLALHYKRPLPWLVGVVPWMLLAVNGYTQYTTAWDPMYFAWWGGTAMVIVCALMALQTRGLDIEEEEAETPKGAEKYTEEAEAYKEQQEKIGKATARRTSGRRSPK